MKINWNQVLISLFLGLLTGFGLGSWQGRDFFRRDGSPERRYERLLKRFNSKLKLTVEQKTSVGTILDNKRKKIELMRAEAKPRFEELRATTRAEIRKVLTPEQQEKFDVMQSRWESRRKKRGSF